MSTRLSAQVRAPGGRVRRGLKSRPRAVDNFIEDLRVLEGDMDFLTFLVDWVRGLDWGNHMVLVGAAALALMAYFKRWFLIVMAIATMVTGKAIEFYFPEATGAFVADLTLVQVIYILGGVLIVIVALGQMVLRH
jgi:hypothetical protein